MDVTAHLDAPCEPARLFGLIDELTGYPRWMPLAHRVSITAPTHDGRPAWEVELRARLGPFARSKRLRMERAVHEPTAAHVQFERVELDGRQHAPWLLDATVTEHAGGSRLEMVLHYGGALWTGGVMERVLAEQIVAGRERLLGLVADLRP